MPESCDDIQWRKFLAINQEGTVFGSRYGLDAILKSREPGSIIGLSSTAAIKGYTAHHAYAAMKGAVIGHHTGDFRDARLFGNQIDLGLIRK